MDNQSAQADKIQAKSENVPPAGAKSLDYWEDPNRWRILHIQYEKKNDGRFRRSGSRMIHSYVISHQAFDSR
jgi:hypothetical protein